MVPESYYVALSAVLLCWLAFQMGAWAFSLRAGFYAGLILSTCIGLWLFTRIQIPDVTITATISLALWAFLRALEDDEPHPARWSAIMAAAIGTGLLLKGLIAAVFPIAAALLYLAFTRQFTKRRTWQRLRVGFLPADATVRALLCPGVIKHRLIEVGYDHAGFCRKAR
jgi:4-amino-4-deoxy-L-arabinose transferase-like glycosyltransferase